MKRDDREPMVTPVLIRQFQCKYVRGLYYMRDRSRAAQKHDYACETTPTHARTTHITAGGTMQVSLKGSRTERGERFIFIFVWRVLNENGSRRLCSFALLHFYFFFSKVPLLCCAAVTKDATLLGTTRLRLCHRPFLSFVSKELVIAW